MVKWESWQDGCFWLLQSKKRDVGIKWTPSSMDVLYTGAEMHWTAVNVNKCILDDDMSVFFFVCVLAICNPTHHLLCWTVYMRKCVRAQSNITNVKADQQGRATGLVHGAKQSWLRWKQPESIQIQQPSLDPPTIDIISDGLDLLVSLVLVCVCVCDLNCSNLTL